MFFCSEINPTVFYSYGFEIQILPCWEVQRYQPTKKVAHWVVWHNYARHDHRIIVVYSSFFMKDFTGIREGRKLPEGLACETSSSRIQHRISRANIFC